MDISVADESLKSPTEESPTTEVQEKKRKKKKSWSFRSISFSKKDKSKPAVKDQAAADVKTETVQEVSCGFNLILNRTFDKNKIILIESHVAALPNTYLYNSLTSNPNY